MNVTLKTFFHVFLFIFIVFFELVHVIFIVPIDIEDVKFHNLLVIEVEKNPTACRNLPRSTQNRSL